MYAGNKSHATAVKSCQGRGFMSVFCQAFLCFLVASPAVAQSQAFAKITIKPAHSADPRASRLQVLPNGDLIASGVPVITLLSYAYDVPLNPSPRISPLPEWAVRERYDIEAKATSNATGLGSEDGTRRRAQRVLRSLLADGFGLVMRAKNERMSVYALTIVSGGHKLHKADIAGKECTFDTDPGACHNFVPGFGHPLNAKAIDMDDLTHYLENWTDLPVVNRTALSGLFTLHTTGWVPMRLPPPPPDAMPGANPFASLPTVFEVLGKLGLQLNQQQDILPVYTVERIERPALN